MPRVSLSLICPQHAAARLGRIRDRWSLRAAGSKSLRVAVVILESLFLKSRIFTGRGGASKEAPMKYNLPVTKLAGISGFSGRRVFQKFTS
jgi:hypothetical protein